MTCFYLTNAHTVLPDQTLEDAAIVIEQDRITAINPPHAPARAVEQSLDGAWLMPGLIDLHSDAIERFAEPRAGTAVPLAFAIQQLDRFCALVGITTCYHSPSFAGAESGSRSDAGAAELVRAIKAYAPDALIDNRSHCRFEVTEPGALAAIVELMEANACDLLSVMDHSPGQGQFKSAAAYKYYLTNNRGLSAAEVDQLLANRAAAAAGVRTRLQHVAAETQARGIPLASHDDDAPERVATMAALGVRISEFPITRAAAQAAHAQHLATVVGAPNVLRGSSHDGNLSALELIAEKLGTCITSDYIPAAILPAVFRVRDVLDWPLERCVALATAAPADAVALGDRGRIIEGGRADLIAVVTRGNQPAVTGVWSRGRKVLTVG